MNGLAGKEVHIDDQFLHVDLMDGRRISTPIHWYPELEQATLNDLKHYQFICDGTGIEWSTLDYHLNIENMLQFEYKQNVA
ncbi:MAG: DUF2442 domain-containing protein [Thiomicrospira sp.]|jgi:hypothetical protein|nr:DUF2442 domain-containing protein [Thiomicrospira sp.]